VNARSRTALDFAQWVEYCNAPRGSTTLAELREADGSPEPHNVRYWGVGNEPWGCGGRLAPEEYAEEYRRFSAWVPRFPAASSSARDEELVRPLLVAGGPEDQDYEWTRRFLAAMTGSHTRLPFGISIHDYFNHDDDVFTFNASGWYTMLQQPQLFDAILQRHAATVQEGVRALQWPRPVTLVLDEWGPCYHSTGNGNPSHLLEQIPTMRDALLTSLMFDMFHAHADVLGMTTVAQSVNCLHSLFLTEGEQYMRTPVYHAFALYQPHIGGTSVRTVAAADQITFTDETNGRRTSAINGVSVSATRHAASAKGDAHIVVTVTNPRLTDAASATISLRGVTIRSGDVTQLTHADPHAHNTFEAPNTVHLSATTPLALPSSTPSGTFTLTLPPASITRVVCRLV
jgi:alpha-N-arabinofuranosidase